MGFISPNVLYPTSMPNNYTLHKPNSSLNRSQTLLTLLINGSHNKRILLMAYVRMGMEICPQKTRKHNELECRHINI